MTYLPNRSFSTRRSDGSLVTTLEITEAALKQKNPAHKNSAPVAIKGMLWPCKACTSPISLNLMSRQFLVVLRTVAFWQIPGAHTVHDEAL